MILRMEAHNLSQLSELLRIAPDITREEMGRALAHATALLHGELTRPPAQGGLPVGAGGAAGLAGSISTRQEWQDEDTVIGLVETSSPYARFVEEGTKPHWMPIQPLIDWALARLPDVNTEKDAKAAAFAVRGAIARRGTKAKPIWRTTWNQQENKLREIFEGVAERIVQRINRAGGTP